METAIYMKTAIMPKPARVDSSTGKKRGNNLEKIDFFIAFHYWLTQVLRRYQLSVHLKNVYESLACMMCRMKI